MGTHPIFESDFDCLTDKMKFLATLLAGLAMANPAPGDPAPAPEGGSASIIMINMNMANIQMNMGDFRGSSVAEDGPMQNNENWSFMEKVSEDDMNTIRDMLENNQVKDGLEVLTEKLPGFSSFFDSLTAESTTEATTTQAAEAEWVNEEDEQSFWHRTKHNCPVIKPFFNSPEN